RRPLRRIEDAHGEIAAQPIHLADHGEEVVKIGFHARELRRRRARALPSLERLSLAVHATLGTLTPRLERSTELRGRDGVLPLDALGARAASRWHVSARVEIDGQTARG